MNVHGPTEYRERCAIVSDFFWPKCMYPNLDIECII